MTRVRFLRGTGLGGIGNDAVPGDERDIPDAQAAQLIAGRRAVAIPSEPVADAPAPAEDAPPPPAPALRKKGK